MLREQNAELTEFLIPPASENKGNFIKYSLRQFKLLYSVTFDLHLILQ